MRRFLLLFLLIGAALIAVFLFLKRTDVINPNPDLIIISKVNWNSDIEPQKPLANPPSEIKAIYLTSWSAGSDKQVDYFLDLIKKTELNAAVVDIKDYSGYVAYDIKDDAVNNYHAKDLRIRYLNKLVKKFHDEGVYIIARITVFQDPVLAKARPDLAVKDQTTGGIWMDNKKLSWVDPASREVWDYNIAIAKDAAARGFDEINFDYVRFPSDGNMENMVYPVWDGKTPKSKVIKNFFSYLRSELKGVKISADLFGLSTVSSGDMGIGQIIEDAYRYFDFVSPMVYPSHYSDGFIGYKNPAQYPYEVIKYSLETAVIRLKKYEAKLAEFASNSTSTSSTTPETPNSTSTIVLAKLRPWLQDFNLGADYTPEMVRKEIQAIYDSGLNYGWMLWNAGNVYTKDALLNE